MRVREVNRVVWYQPMPWPLDLGFTTNQAAYRREAKRLGVVNPSESFMRGVAATTHFLDPKERGGFGKAIVCVDARRLHKLGPAHLASTVCHEVVHVWQEIKCAMGEEHPGAEVEAYAIQFMVLGILNDLWGDP